MGARRYPLGGRVDGTDGRTLSLYQTVCGGGFGTGLACDSTDRRQSRRCPTITYVPPLVQSGIRVQYTLHATTRTNQ